MILEVRHLRVVQAIVREGSVTGAAERLHLTQPAISHTIRDLEDRLCVTLFRRSKKKMEPTPEGLRLLRTAEAVLGEVERAEHDLKQFCQGKRGVVRIATQCYTCYHWLPRILHRFNESLPDVDLQIVPEATRCTAEALLAETIDVAIMHRVPERSEIALTRLFDDEVVAIFAPDHRLAGKKWVEPQDFADEHLLLHVAPEESHVMSAWLAPAGVRPRRMSQLSLTEAIFETVKAGLGVSAVARWMVAAELAAGAIASARLAPKGLKRTWHAATRRGGREQAATKELIRLLKTAAPKHEGALAPVRSVAR